MSERGADVCIYGAPTVYQKDFHFAPHGTKQNTFVNLGVTISCFRGEGACTPSLA